MIKKILFFLFLTIQTAQSGIRDPDTPDSKYIDYGKKYTCVLRISSITEDRDKSYASAVMISPKWALTAAHVVKNRTNTKIFLDNNEEIEVEKIFIPIEFNNNFEFYDIALCKLKKDIELNYYAEIYENNDEVGKIASLAGFGITGTFSSDQRIESKIRRAGYNRVDRIDKQLLICSPSRKDKTELEFLITYGDSGGGLFIDKKLAGIHSCVLASDKKTDSSYGDESGHTRVSFHKNWIKKIINEN